MKHLSRISKNTPLMAYEPPRSILDVRSWSDIVVGIGLAMQKKLEWWLAPPAN